MDDHQEFGLKRKRIAAMLERSGLGGVLLGTRHNFAWLTGGGRNFVNQASDVGVAAVLVTAEHICCFCANIEAERIADEEVGHLGIEVVGYPWWEPAQLGRLLAERLDPAQMAADVHLAGVPAAVRPLPTGFDRLRWKLTEAEMERYRQVGAIVGRELEAACRSAHVGLAEHRIAAALTSRLAQEGVRTPVVLVAADERVRRYRHPIPTDNRVKRYFMLVVCGERQGLICSATRLVHFGRPPDELVAKHQAVCRVDGRMIGATRPGVTLGAVFTEAQAAYAEAGWADEWRLHHQGGPTGYLSRDAKATPNSDVAILEDQAFAWNPSIAGTKSEDTVLVTAEGNELLTATGEWPSLEIDAESAKYSRPDILVL
ncbi:MAG TPA: M24 family metallopeptidase [Phycisphaerae bacterium]|nr:M24 family metallopeptidase [Phycisphaerae bacterium]